MTLWQAVVSLQVRLSANWLSCSDSGNVVCTCLWSPSSVMWHTVASGQCIRRGDRNTQLLFSVNSTGYKFRRESNTGYVFWSIAASMTRRRLSSPSHFTWPLKLMLVAFFDRPARRHLLCRQPAGPRSVTEPFQWQRRVPGTLCHRASGLSCHRNAFRDDLKTVLLRASFDDRTRLPSLTLTTDISDLCSCSLPCSS